MEKNGTDKKPKKYKRSKLLINPGFQLPFIGWAAAMSGVVIAIFYGANLHFFNDYYEQGRRIGLPEDHVFFKFLTSQFVKMNWIFLVTAVVVMGVIVVSGLVFSHRICGPLYKLGMHLRGITRGNPITEVRFRKGDYFREIETAFNDFLLTVTKRK